MIKQLILIGVLFLICFSVIAQKEGQPLADSLEQVLTRNDISEIERVNVLTRLTFEYRNLLPSKAIAFGDQAEKMAKEINYEKKLGEIYIYQSYAYTFYNDIIKSYELSLKALKYNTENKVTNLIPISKLNVFSTNPNNRRGADISELLVILKDVNTINDKLWYIRTIGGIGNELKETSASLISDSLINLAIVEARKNNFKFLEMHNLARIESSLMYRKEYDKALRLIEQLNSYFETIGEKRIYSELLNEAADIYLLKAEMYPEKKYLDSAQLYANRAMQKSSEIDYKNLLVSNYLTQFRLNKKTGNFTKAIDYLEKYVALNDTLYGQNSSRKLEGIAIRQRDEIAAAQLKIKDAEVATQKIFTYAGFAGIGLTGLFLFFVFRNYKNQKKSNEIISMEKQRSEELLLNILPAEMAEELKTNGTTKAKAFTMVTVMFTDFKDFTTVSEKVSAELLVDEIHYCFSAFDRIIQKYKIEKIKTIGDSYMCASGLPVSNYTHATDMLAAAFEIRDFMLQRKKEKEGLDEIPFELRIGIHTGPVVAGIVGIKKFAYDIWGDTVNMAARMEQNSAAGKINISGNTYELVKSKFNCEHRGKISAKNKGEIDMYFVEKISS